MNLPALPVFWHLYRPNKMSVTPKKPLHQGIHHTEQPYGMLYLRQLHSEHPLISRLPVLLKTEPLLYLGHFYRSAAAQFVPLIFFEPHPCIPYGVIK